jgi:D-aminoacyl-tRNA deacylase
VTVIILASETDPAAMNIADKLVTNFRFTPFQNHHEENVYSRGNIRLVHTDSDILDLQQIDCCDQVESVICISRHRSESRRPTLTAHIPGNPGPDASLGGVPRTLAWADPHRLKSALRGLLESARQLELKEYSVSLEATHHGPTQLEIPILFVEIGSTKEQWLNPRAGEAAAAAALKAATEPKTGRPAVGFGGGHYTPRHTTKVLNTEYAVGHILADHFFEDYDPDVVRQAFKKTFGGCDTALIDWKGLKSDCRKSLVSTLEDMNIEVIRS